MYDLFIKGGLVYTEQGFYPMNIVVKGERIAGLICPNQEVEAEKVIDATGMHVLI